MSNRRLLAGWLIIGAIAGLTSPQVRAADEPAAATQPAVWTGLVPDDAFAAVALYPNRVLTSPALAKFDLTGLTEDLTNQTGISAADIEQVVVLMGPLKGAHRQPYDEGIIRLSKPIDRAALTAKLLKEPEEAEIGGHKYFRRARGLPKNMQRDDDSGVCFVDDRTFITFEGKRLSKILASKDAKSMLISALAENDPAADATIIFTNTDAAKEMIAEAIPTKSLAGPLKPLGDLPDLLQVAKLDIRTNPEISLKLTLLGKDDDSADKMAQMIKSFQQLGQAFLPAVQVALVDDAPPAQKLIAELATKLIGGLVPHRTGKQVTVEIGNLGTVDTVVGKLVMPAIMAARSAARRMQGMNNLKQLALGMMLKEASLGTFPAHAIYSKDGKPLLSWRVSLLPQFGQPDLYTQFHLDEPWDSEHNKPLIAKMPAIFKSSGGKPLADGQTRYVIPIGKDTIFEGDKGIAPSQVLDGMSNTLLILEVGDDKAVTWTKPDDMEFDPQKPLAGLGTIGDDGMPVAFADGSVRMIRKSVDAETFRRLILRNDGQPIDPGKL